MSAGARLAVVGVALVAALLVLRFSLPGGPSGPSGPWGSSYATSAGGEAAYADLLAQAGHRVERLRLRPREGVPTPDATLVLLEPDAISADDAAALRRFVLAGGRLVVADSDPGSWLGSLLEHPPTWSSNGDERARATAPVAETTGVSTVTTPAGSTFSSAAGSLPILAGRSGSAALASDLGAGRVVLLADASMLANHWLARDDNAAFGLAIAGPAERPVAFVEGVHGYGRGAGLGALPHSWRYGLAALVLALLALMWARGRRLGPPEQRERSLAPPRRAYAEAMAQVLVGASRDGGAAENVREAAAELARRRSGVLTPEEVAALGEPIKSSGQALAAGRALARLQRKERA
jgi:Domain of unknown function (DUF4350)